MADSFSAAGADCDVPAPLSVSGSRPSSLHGSGSASGDDLSGAHGSSGPLPSAPLPSAPLPSGPPSVDGGGSRRRFGVAGAVYGQLVDAFIRPPRATYRIDDLGSARFALVGGCPGAFGGSGGSGGGGGGGGGPRGAVYVRRDFSVLNARGMEVMYSVFGRARRRLSLEDSYASSSASGGSADSALEPAPCVVYCHGNSGSRLDALDAVRLLLPLGLSVVAVDFCGSGMSEGEYVSLGYYEKDDLHAVVQSLRRDGLASSVALWGRSMGAVTCLRYAREHPEISCMVLDSPFYSLTRVCKEFVEQMQKRIPKMVVSLGLKVVRKSIRNRARFDIYKLNVRVDAALCRIPAFFIHGSDDRFISAQHSADLYNVYGGEKSLILTPGGHNDLRPRLILAACASFFQNFFLETPELPLFVGHDDRSTVRIINRRGRVDAAAAASSMPSQTPSSSSSATVSSAPLPAAASAPVAHARVAAVPPAPPFPTSLLYESDSDAGSDDSLSDSDSDSVALTPAFAESDVREALRISTEILLDHSDESDMSSDARAAGALPSGSLATAGGGGGAAIRASVAPARGGAQSDSESASDSSSEDAFPSRKNCYSDSAIGDSELDGAASAAARLGLGLNLDTSAALEFMGDRSSMQSPKPTRSRNMSVNSLAGRFARLGASARDHVPFMRSSSQTGVAVEVMHDGSAAPAAAASGSGSKKVKKSKRDKEEGDSVSLHKSSSFGDEEFIASLDSAAAAVQSEALEAWEPAVAEVGDDETGSQRSSRSSKSRNKSPARSKPKRVKKDKE